MSSRNSRSASRSFAALLPAAFFALTVAGCGPEVVRGSNDPSIDSRALSTGLDKDDIQRALHETLNNLRAAPIMNEWRSTNPPPNVAIFPIANSTSEHIDSMLDALLGETETWMVESGTVQVISRERQMQMIREVEHQQQPVFNPSHAAQYGKQLGAKFYITGKVSGNDERSSDMRRVQYFIYLQVIDVETSEIRFSAKSEITKAIK